MNWNKAWLNYLFLPKVTTTFSWRANYPKPQLVFFQKTIYTLSKILRCNFNVETKASEITTWRDPSMRESWANIYVCNFGFWNVLYGIGAKFIRFRNSAMQPIHPHMPFLPKEPVEGNIYLFKNTGVDFIGLLELLVLSRPVKHRFCWFTWFFSGADHIQVVNGLDIDSCMSVVTRFIARRGRRTLSLVTMELTLWELLVNSKILSMTGIEMLCLSD